MPAAAVEAMAVAQAAVAAAAAVAVAAAAVRSRHARHGCDAWRSSCPRWSAAAALSTTDDTSSPALDSFFTCTADKGKKGSAVEVEEPIEGKSSAPLGVADVDDLNEGRWGLDEGCGPWVCEDTGLGAGGPSRRRACNQWKSRMGRPS